MPKPRKERGRPMKRPYPPRVDATAEEIARAVFFMPADHEWEYKKVDADVIYRCDRCRQAVYFPETLYVNGLCESCHSKASS